MRAARRRFRRATSAPSAPGTRARPRPRSARSARTSSPTSPHRSLKHAFSRRANFWAGMGRLGLASPRDSRHAMNRRQSSAQGAEERRGRGRGETTVSIGCHASAARSGHPLSSLRGNSLSHCAFADLRSLIQPLPSCPDFAFFSSSPCACARKPTGPSSAARAATAAISAPIRAASSFRSSPARARTRT